MSCDVYSVSYDGEYQFSTSSLFVIRDFIKGKFASKLKIIKNGVEFPRKRYSFISEEIINELKYFQHPSMITTIHLESELFEL